MWIMLTMFRYMSCVSTTLEVEDCETALCTCVRYVVQKADALLLAFLCATA